MKTNEKSEKALALAMIGLQATLRGQIEAQKNLSRDVIKLRAEIISMSERVRPDEIARLYAEIKKSRIERDEVCSQLCMLAVDCSDAFGNLAEALRKLQEQNKKDQPQLAGLKAV